MFPIWPFGKKEKEVKKPSSQELKLIQLKIDAPRLHMELQLKGIRVEQTIMYVNDNRAQIYVYPPELAPLRVVMTTEEVQQYLDKYHPTH